MLKNTILAGSLVASCLLLSTHAAESKVKTMWFSLTGGDGIAGPIVVVSDDGEKWNRIKDKEIFLEGNVRVKTSTEKIGAFGLYWGACSGNGCREAANTPLMHSLQIGSKPKEINKYVMIDFSTSLIPGNAIEGFPVPPPNSYGYHIISKCNQALAQGVDIHKGHNFTFTVPITLAVETYVLGGGPVESLPEGSLYILDDIDDSKTTIIGIPVTCEAAPQKYHIAIPPVPFKVTGAELYLATFKGDGPAPSQGASCKVLKVTARFPTTTSGLVHFDLSHKVGDQGLKTIPITIESKQKPDGTFAAEYVKDWFLDKTTYAQFMVQETDGQGLSAGWKDINVTCGNELADPTSQPPSDQPELKVLKSKFTVTTFKSDSVTGCPVNAALDVEFITNKPGSVPFKVTGTDGFVWNNSVKAEEEFGPLQIGEGQAQFAKTYRAKHRRMLTVTKATNANYSLEVRNVAVEPSAKTAGPDNLKVSCAGDLAVPFAVMDTELNIVGLPGCPTTAFAAATFVTNGPGDVRYRLSSTTGAVDTGTAKAEKVGNRFVAKYQLPVKITKGGEVVFTAMPLDFPKKLALAKKQYNCGGPNPGTVSGGGKTKPQTDPKKIVADPPKLTTPPKTVAPIIVTPKPIACTGGSVKNGKCVCRTGFQMVKAASNAFRCVQKAPAATLGLPKATKQKAQ